METFAAANLCNFCNQRCVYCMEGDRVTPGYSRLSLAQVKRNLRILKEEKNINTINIMGGEFTLRPDALPILDYIKNLGINTIIITTNLSRFADYDFACAVARRVTALDVTVPSGISRRNRQ